MATEIQKFKKALKERFFKTSGNSNFSYFMLTPSTYRNENGDLIQTGNINVMIFGGANTPKGSLGCVSMAWQGKVKPYRCRTVIDNQVMSYAFVAKDAKHAIAAFDKWHESTKTERKKWKLII